MSSRRCNAFNSLRNHMPSPAHQSLLLWLIRKMAADGFVVAGCDGLVPQGGVWNTLPIPPYLAGVRPDAWGFAPASGTVAVGEAKTWTDIDTSHTRKQLCVLGRLVQRDDGRRCHLYFAVPRSAASNLDRVLAQVGLLGARHLVRLHIPDCFVTETRDECA